MPLADRRCDICGRKRFAVFRHNAALAVDFLILGWRSDEIRIRALEISERRHGEVDFKLSYNIKRMKASELLACAANCASVGWGPHASLL